MGMGSLTAARLRGARRTSLGLASPRGEIRLPDGASPMELSLSTQAATLRASSRPARPGFPLSGRRGLAVRVLRGVTVFGLCAYAAHSLTGVGGHGLDGFFENWVFNGLLFAGAALCLLRVAFFRLERGAWTALSVGLGCWALGDVLFTLDPSQVTAGVFPSTSDFLWLVVLSRCLPDAGPVGTRAGAPLLPQPVARRRRGRSGRCGAGSAIRAAQHHRQHRGVAEQRRRRPHLSARRSAPDQLCRRAFWPSPAGVRVESLAPWPSAWR